jgi:hypothetical protein
MMVMARLPLFHPSTSPMVGVLPACITSNWLTNKSQTVLRATAPAMGRLSFPSVSENPSVVERQVTIESVSQLFSQKIGWFVLTLIAAFILNFTLPRLMPGDPVAAIVARMAQGMSNASGVQAVYEQYTELFGTNKPIITQFFIYIQNVFRGDFGFSISQYPRTVADVISASVLWTIALQFPAILVGGF